jgi:hypothetical protein
MENEEYYIEIVKELEKKLNVDILPNDKVTLYLVDALGPSVIIFVNGRNSGAMLDLRENILEYIDNNKEYVRELILSSMREFNNTFD